MELTDIGVETVHAGGETRTGLNPVYTTIMKKRKYYRLAEKRFPEEKDRKLLAILAEGLRRNNGEEPSKEEMGF